MDGNYERLVEFISQNSGLPMDEIDRKIEAKRAKLAGLISKEGAAQVVAAELNINFEKQSIKISQIVPGMRKINLVGKVISLNPIREYNKNGKSGRIGSFILADETSNIRTVLWDENHIELIAKGQIGMDSVIEVVNASIRNGELHLGSFSEIKMSEKVISQTKTDKPTVRKLINNFNPNENASTRAFIVQIFEPRFFEICPECKKKVSGTSECETHGKVVSIRRALLNFVADDGSESIRSVIFSEQLEKIIPMDELTNPEMFSIRKKDWLGKEVVLSGQVRKNALYNNMEYIVNDISEIKLDKLIEELEKQN